MPKLTDRVVDALTCNGLRETIAFDGVLKGFGVRISPTGKKTFLFQYRAPAGVRRLRLGVFGSELTTAQARSRAEVLRGQVRDGHDPVADRRKARAAAIADAADADRAAAETVYTLRRLIEAWDSLHLAKLRPSYRRDAMGRLRLHLSALMETPASGVSRAAAAQELDRIAAHAGATTARRVMGYARSAYAWAKQRGAVDANPFHGLPPHGSEVRRDRVLSDAEVGALWRAADCLGPVHGGFARFLLLTLARRQEVAGMRWGEVSTDLNLWTLPGERAKNGKPHLVYLAEPARDILRCLPRGNADGLVFATLTGKELTVFSYIARVLGTRGTVAGWRLHDFRRTGVTALAGMGFAPHVCDRLLNHVTGAIQGVAAVYQRHDFAAERRAALVAWAAHVVACGDGGLVADNVVPLRAAGAG